MLGSRAVVVHSVVAPYAALTLGDAKSAMIGNILLPPFVLAIVTVFSAAARPAIASRNAIRPSRKLTIKLFHSIPTVA